MDNKEFFELEELEEDLNEIKQKLILLQEHQKMAERLKKIKENKG